MSRCASRAPRRAWLHTGDHYKITFTPDKDAYVYIFQADSSGQMFQLFPMEDLKGVRVDNFNPVRTGQQVVLPAPDKAFRLDDKTGTERIYFIASVQPNAEIEALYDELMPLCNS